MTARPRRLPRSAVRPSAARRSEQRSRRPGATVQRSCPRSRPRRRQRPTRSPRIEPSSGLLFCAGQYSTTSGGRDLLRPLPSTGLSCATPTIGPVSEQLSAERHVIGHLDMDAFYVSVELRRRPELRGLPVIVAGGGPRAVVTTASYEARRFGIGSAMPAARARRLCSDGVFLTPDFTYYREASREVMVLVRECAESIEVVGLDEAYLDLSGLPAPHAEMRRLAREIELQTTLGCSIGIGPNKLVAKVASDAEKPRGFVVLTSEQARARFAGSRCSLVPGIGPKTAERLRSCGFDTPGTHERTANSESRETTFDFDVSGLGALEPILVRLATELCETLERQQRRGRTIGIKVRLDDFSTHTRARTLAEPVGSADRVSPVAVELLRRFSPPRPVRLLGVRVAGLQESAADADEQLTLAV